MSDVPVVLVVEDSADDARLIQRAFEKAGALNQTRIVRDADEAVSYLSGAGVFADRKLYPMPALVLLDRNMPLRDGFEVLSWIRGQRELTGLPVVILAGIERPSDVSRAYSLGANSFLVKPTEFEAFTAMVNTLKGFWLDRAMTPKLGG